MTDLPDKTVETLTGIQEEIMELLRDECPHIAYHPTKRYLAVQIARKVGETTTRVAWHLGRLRSRGLVEKVRAEGQYSYADDLRWKLSDDEIARIWRAHV